MAKEFRTMHEGYNESIQVLDGGDGDVLLEIKYTKDGIEHNVNFFFYRKDSLALAKKIKKVSNRQLKGEN